MRVWLITIGEPLPTDSADERLLRTGILAGMLAGAGHEVLWWTSSFDHVRKMQRCRKDTKVRLSDNYSLALMHSSGYRRNISLARVRDHRQHAKTFARLAPQEAAPDVILCSMPTIELSGAAVRYATERGIPIALDVRDLWPDIFIDHAPSWARGMARLALYPMFRDLRWACSRATAITGITSPIVSWGVAYAGRSCTGLDRDFPFGYVERSSACAEVEAAGRYWRERGVGDPQEFVVCFFGTIGRQFDLETVIEAARRLDGGERRFRFVLCGSGDSLERYQQQARGVSNVIFPGWVGASEIKALMHLSKMGLAPYHNSEDFRSSLPNKTIEYLSAGLPLLYCLTGVLHELMEKYDSGVAYGEGDVDSLVRSLEQSYDDAQGVSRKAENALALYQLKYTARRVYSDMMEYLENLASSGTLKGKGDACGH